MEFSEVGAVRTDFNGPVGQKRHLDDVAGQKLLRDSFCLSIWLATALTTGVILKRGKEALSCGARASLVGNLGEIGAKVIASQILSRDSGEAVFATRHQGVSQGPLGRVAQCPPSGPGKGVISRGSSDCKCIAIQAAMYRSAGRCPTECFLSVFGHLARSAPHRVLFECFWGLNSAKKQHSVGHSKPSAQKHSSSTPWGTFRHSCTWRPGSQCKCKAPVAHKPHEERRHQKRVFEAEQQGNVTFKSPKISLNKRYFCDFHIKGYMSGFN